MLRQIGSTVVAGSLPLSILLNPLFAIAHRRGWLTDAGLEPQG